MPSMSACAIFNSLSVTAVVDPFFKISVLRISLAKCISSRMRNSPSGFTAARCSRLLITTLATPIFRVRLGNFFVLDRAEIGGTELPETKFLFSRGRVNSHWNINQPEADAAFPDGTHMAGLPFSHTEPCLSIATQSGRLPRRITLQVS